MHESIEKHLKEVSTWLEENVQMYSEPNTVTLSSFQVDWSNFSGQFKVAFDHVVLPEDFRFGLEASGKTMFYMPMFHSPLGAPASYAAIEITENTKTAILNGLRKTFPRLKGAGLDKETRREITFHSPPETRVDAKTLTLAKEKVTQNYSVTINVEK